MYKEVGTDECHPSWLSEFNLSQYPKALVLFKLDPKSRDSWSQAAGAMNISYYHAVIGDVAVALEYLTEAEGLLASLPYFLRRGFQLVHGNLKRYIQTGGSGDETQEDLEILAAVLTLKALTLRAYGKILKGDLLLAPVKCMVEALKLMPGNLLFMYLRAMFEFVLEHRAIHVRPCSQELVKLVFEVEDRLPENPGILDEQVVYALTALVVRSTMTSFRDTYTWKSEVWKWSVDQLWRVIDVDVGGLPVWFAKRVAHLSIYCHPRRRPAMRSFLCRYVRIYPDESKFLFRYGRFLLDAEKDIKGGREILTRAAEVRNRHAIKAIVYLARSHLKAGGKDAVEQVQKMFDDFEVKVPESASHTVTMIHRGGFRLLVAKDFRGAITDWVKAMDVDPDLRLLASYTQDWCSTGRMHTISPIEIMREELPAYIEGSTGADHALYKDALEKVEDVYRRRKSLALLAVTANVATDLQELENLFMMRIRRRNEEGNEKVSDRSCRSNWRSRR